MERHLSYRDGRRAACAVHLPLARSHRSRRRHRTRSCTSSISMPTLARHRRRGSARRPADRRRRSARLSAGPAEPNPAGKASSTSSRTKLRAAKWRNWKLHFVWEAEPNEGPIPSRNAVALQPAAGSQGGNRRRRLQASWVRGPMRRLVLDFQGSLKALSTDPAGRIRRLSAQSGILIGIYGGTRCRRSPG